MTRPPSCSDELLLGARMSVAANCVECDLTVDLGELTREELGLAHAAEDRRALISLPQVPE